MWKLLIGLVLLVNQNLTSSEQVAQEAENIREPRQLNFGDCCPCPTQDVFQDQDSANTRINTATIDDCPCRPMSDAVGSSSIFSPAFRAVEPFIKPHSKKDEPKPLLNPEVGLASSVLQTLQEVTDQEYQEALARDAARSALKLIGPETEPRHVVNVILSPKEANNDEMISEATEYQGTSCILPPLGINNNFEPLRLQPPMNLLKKILTPMKFRSNGILNRNTFDMDGSASNNQDRISPLKSNILENMKTRSNLFNLRPFPYTDNRDNTPNLLQKYHVKNNIRDRILSPSRPLLDVQPTTNKLSEAFARTITSDKKVGVEQDIISDFNQHLSVPCAITKKKITAFSEDNIPQNSDYKEINTFLNNNLKDFDVVPSSSNTVEVKKPSVIENHNIAEQDRSAEMCSDKIMGVDTVTNIYSTLQATTDINSMHDEVEATTERIVESAKAVDEQIIEPQIQCTTENLDDIKDMEPESSIARNVIESLQDLPSKDSTSTDENYVSPKKNAPSISAEKDIVPSNTHTLPNIKADIFRTLENFKRANERIQDKLRSNVQDALQLVITSEPPKPLTQTDTDTISEMRASSLESTQKPTNSVTKDNISTEDLQKMSDSLLELNSLKGNPDTTTMSTCKDNLSKEFEYKSAKVDKVPNNNDMITSPTTSVDIKSKADTEQINKSDENLKNLCSNNAIPKNVDSSTMNNEENEMSAQPSNTAYNRIPQLDLNQKDFIVQPDDKVKPMEGIKEFFDSFKYLGTDLFTNDNNESAYLAKQPLNRLKNNKNIDYSKSSAGSYTPNSNSKLSSYKAKVASPKFLDKSILPNVSPSDREADVLGFASQGMPQSTNFKNIFSNVEDEISPLFKSIYKSKVPQGTLSSIAPSISKNLQSNADEAFKSLRNSLNLADKEPLTINKNNVLSKSLINPDNLFGAVLKTHEDFNAKLQDFHSDLNRRLSSISSRMPTDIPRLLPPSRLKNLKNRAEVNNFPSKIGMNSVSSKQKQLLPKNSPFFEILQKKSITSVTTPRPNIKQKLSSHQKDIGTKKGPISLTPPKRNNLKIKPLKENKVTISFATTSMRPDILKSRFNSDSVKLPKLTKNLVNKKVIPKSKFESSEPKVLASDISLSRAQPPDTVRQSKVTKNISSLDEPEISLQNDIRRSTDLPEMNKSKTPLLSKLRNGFTTRIPSGSMKRNNKILASRQNENTDTTQSVSNNIDSNIAASSLVGQTLKDENQSFKCKMVCIKDFLDSTDIIIKK